MFKAEADLSPVVAEWLRTRGLEVCAEVPGLYNSIDLVGVDFDAPLVVAVELKLGFTAKLFQQARHGLYIAHEAWAAAPSLITTRVRVEAERTGVGILQVTPTGVSEIRRPSPVSLAPDYRAQRLKKMLHKLKTHPRDGVGGLPCGAGEGPAQRVARLVREYLASHPGADWEEVYNNVPNHYAHKQSLRGTMNNWHGIRLPGDRKQ